MATPVTRSLREDLHRDLRIPENATSYTPEQHRALQKKVQELIAPHSSNAWFHSTKVDERIIALAQGRDLAYKGTLANRENPTSDIETDERYRYANHSSDDLHFLAQFVLSDGEKLGFKFLSILSYLFLFGFFCDIYANATVSRIKAMIREDAPGQYLEIFQKKVSA